MMYLGDFRAGQTVYLSYNTSDADGAKLDWDSGGGVGVCKNNNWDNELTNSESYIDTTLGTGDEALHTIEIDLSGNTDFFLPGCDYAVRVGGVVDGVTVGLVVAHFSIENRSISADIAEPTGDPADWDFQEKLLWLVMRFLNKHSSDNFNGIRVYKEDGTLATSQAVTEAGGVKTVNKAS